MDFFPEEFPAQAQAQVEAAKIHAYRKLDEEIKKASWRSEQETLIRDCIMQIFFTFAEGACVLGSKNIWTVAQIQAKANEFLRRLTITVCHEKSPDRSIANNWINHMNGSLSQEVERQLKGSAQWKQFEDLLLTVADEQMKSGRERGHDYEISQQRVALEDTLRSELGTIKSKAERYSTLEKLKNQFPDYQLWKILSMREQQELLDEEFKPTAFARSLVARTFGVVSETIKKDRQKLRNRNK